MKKLLALVLVLGLTSLASADLVLTVDGNPVTQGQITISPSQTIELDLELTSGENILQYDVAYVLSNAQAELTLPNQTPPYYGLSFPAVFDMKSSVTGMPTAQYVEIMGGQMSSPALVGPQVIMQGLILHCLEATPVDLTVVVVDLTTVDGLDIPIGTILGTLHITQIPEPVTIALLGLGSLFLRKRS